jgi:hypothetical protein
VGFTFEEVGYEGDPAVDGAAGFTELYSPGSTIEAITDAGWIRYQLKLLTVVAYNVNGEEI